MNYNLYVVPPSPLACASWFWSSCYSHNAKDLEEGKKNKRVVCQIIKRINMQL